MGKEGKGGRERKSTKLTYFINLLLIFIGRVPQKEGGRIRLVGRCRHIGQQRRPKIRAGRNKIGAKDYYKISSDKSSKTE